MHLIPANSKESAHYHFDIRYLLHAHEDDRFQKNHESKELLWIAKTDPIPTNSEAVIRMFHKWHKIDF